jgi:Fe-S-cluster containining protein
MAVTICDREAQKIDQYLGIKRVPQKKLDLSVIDLLAYREKTVEQWLGVPCTFLAEDGSCRIYEVRPMACRVFWNLSDYPQLCDCSTKLPVPSVDMGLVHLAAASMTYEEEFGDIREYYPLPKF